MGERDARFRDDRTDDLGGFQLTFGCQRRKERGDADGGDAGVADLHRCVADFVAGKRHQRATVIFMAAMDHEGQRIDAFAQIIRPVDHRRQGSAGRHGDADRGDAFQTRTLDDGIGKMGRADHHGVDRRGAGRLRGDDVTDGVDDALHHIRGGGKLDGRDDFLAIDEHGIRICAADVNSDPLHAANTDLKSRSYPKARGPTCSRPLGLVRTAGAGRATTVTRWP
ncbi:hypothetical protein D3C80_521190 [compost metagenome]